MQTVLHLIHFLGKLLGKIDTVGGATEKQIHTVATLNLDTGRARLTIAAATAEIATKLLAVLLDACEHLICQRRRIVLERDKFVKFALTLDSPNRFHMGELSQIGIGCSSVVNESAGKSLHRDKAHIRRLALLGKREITGEKALDPARRAQVKDICTALAARGLSLLIAVRHEDEIPACVTDVMTLDKGRAPSFRAAEPVRTETNPAAPQVCGAAVADSATDAKPVVELKHIHLEMGSRVLFADFSWTIRQGERWVLRGANGSGKTTLLSLITGDNPQAYANDVSVFGHVRGDGVELARIRRRIGMVSPEQQAYEGRDAFELLEAALARKPDLLLLDEPCLNLDARMAARLKRRVSAWLRRHPTVAAVCVAHRPEHVPAGFDHELKLGE